MGAVADPFYELRPPNADMATYLTYIEEHIDKDKLPVLHDVLQDPDITEEIGWDLVRVLLPLAPASEACLMDIAKLGNTKEVILKVVESLRAIEFVESEDDDDGDDDDDEKAVASPLAKVVTRTGEQPEPIPMPLPFVQFQILLKMLAVLHPRIKAKFPSRFLSATLQALIASFPFGTPHQDVLAEDLIAFVKLSSGNKRPSVPPRRSSSTIGLTTMASMSALSLVSSHGALSTEEEKIYNRLLQAFVTHVLEDYMQALPRVDGVPGMAYCGRYLEKTKHPLVLPSKVSLTDQFTNSQTLEGRLTVVGQLVALAEDLEISTSDVVKVITSEDPETEGNRGEEESYPQSAEDIPLSKSGALYLFTARRALGLLAVDEPFVHMPTPIAIFPEHAAMVQVFASRTGPEALAHEPDAFLDALLFHGLVALEANDVGEPDDDAEFAEYLQVTSLLSANTPSDELRFIAHYLTTTVLRSHPKETVRFGYIRDTLEHCPFENLRASAVGWIKGETIDAYQEATSRDRHDDNESLFLTPIPLSTLSPFLFPDLRDEYDYVERMDEDEQAELLEQYELHYRLYSASLNFLYMLLHSVHLHERLQLKELVEEQEVLSGFVRPLHQALKVLREGVEADKAKGQNGHSHGPTEVDLGLLACDGIEKKVKELGWTAEE